MQDIDYFSEAKMSALVLYKFSSELPQRLRPNFRRVAEGRPDNVLQGYRGPARLRNGESGDSATEEEDLGIQRIGFWYGISKHWNWIPVSGTAFYGLCRAIEYVIRDSEWKYMYFNAATGALLDSKEVEDIQTRNRKADGHYAKVEKLMQSGKFEEAYNEAKSALDSCSLGYKRHHLFKEALERVDAQRPKPKVPPPIESSVICGGALSSYSQEQRLLNIRSKRKEISPIPCPTTSVDRYEGAPRRGPFILVLYLDLFGPNANLTMTFYAFVIICFFFCVYFGLFHR